MLLKIYGYEASLLVKFYMQENNAPFMTKNVDFSFLPETLLGHSKKTLTEAICTTLAPSKIIVSNSGTLC